MLAIPFSYKHPAHSIKLSDHISTAINFKLAVFFFFLSFFFYVGIFSVLRKIYIPLFLTNINQRVFLTSVSQTCWLVFIACLATKQVYMIQTIKHERIHSLRLREILLGRLSHTSQQAGTHENTKGRHLLQKMR